MKKNVIVSLADENYFELLEELVDSIKSFKQSENIAICILDAGLTDNQKNILAPKVDEIKSSDWDIKISQFKVMGKKWLKSLITRAFLPEYFPKYEKYLILGKQLNYISKVVRMKNYRLQLRQTELMEEY